MEFDGKRAFVTGSSGMGLASALRLARAGAEVHLAGIDDALNAAAAEAAAGLPVSVHRCNVADEASLRALLARGRGARLRYPGQRGGDPDLWHHRDDRPGALGPGDGDEPARRLSDELPRSIPE